MRDQICGWVEITLTVMFPQALPDSRYMIPTKHFTSWSLAIGNNLRIFPIKNWTKGVTLIDSLCFQWPKFSNYSHTSPSSSYLNYGKSFHFFWIICATYFLGISWNGLQVASDATFSFFRFPLVIVSLLKKNLSTIIPLWLFFFSFFTYNWLPHAFSIIPHKNQIALSIQQCPPVAHCHI